MPRKKKEVKLRKAQEGYIFSGIAQCFGLTQSACTTKANTFEALNECQMFPWDANSTKLFAWEVDIHESIMKGNVDCPAVMEMLLFPGEVMFVRDGLRGTKRGLWVAFAEPAEDYHNLPHLLQSCSAKVVINHVNSDGAIYRLVAMPADSMTQFF